MKPSVNFLKPLTVILGCVLLVTFSITSNAGRRTVTPEGFDYLLLYMGTGIFDPNDAEPYPGLTGCEGLFCDGEFFQQEIMGRTEAETGEIKEQAKSFYLERFGIDVDDPALENRVSLRMFTLNPDFQYRLHIASGMKSPEEGWIIRDGGFMLQITDPNGLDLGGESEGKHADHGNAMFFGNYNILVTKRNGKPKKELIIFYKSREPAIIAQDGSMTFRCDMFNEDWGEGLGLGTLTVEPLEDGTIRGNARNVLTFPPTSELTVFPEFPPYDAHPKHRRYYYHDDHDDD